jgi:hypothetical protein
MSTAEHPSQTNPIGSATQKNRALIFSVSDAPFYTLGQSQEAGPPYRNVAYWRDEQGRIQRFPSLFAAKQALAAEGFRESWLVMQTAYDEMIGNPVAQTAELYTPISHDAL